MIKPSLYATNVSVLKSLVDSSKTKYVDQMSKYKQDDGYFAKFLAIYFVSSLYCDILSDKLGDTIVKELTNVLSFAAFDLRLKPTKS